MTASSGGAGARPLRLSKHTALGNDFLVLLDLDDRIVVDAAFARAVCDRRRGVGADGLIKVTRGTKGADLTMALRNADGGEAEMSGNGIRCLGQAVVDAAVVPGPEITVATAAGIRHLTVEPETEPGLRLATVDMGIATIGDTVDGLGGRAVRVDTGNPHLVVLDPEGALDVVALGEANREVNVEVIRVVGDDHLDLRVYERGAGLTLACGTGSCASAAAAHEWGLVGPSVTVTNPGGDLGVDLKPDTVLLSGPTRLVANVELA